MEVDGGLGEGTVHSTLCRSQCTASDTWYLQCVSKKMILSETMFFEPHRAFLELVTELDGLSYYTEVWQGTIGPNFV